MRSFVPAGKPPSDEEADHLLTNNVPSLLPYDKIQLKRLWESLHNDVLHKYREYILHDVVHDCVGDDTIINILTCIWPQNTQLSLNVIHYEMKRVYEVMHLLISNMIIFT